MKLHPLIAGRAQSMRCAVRGLSYLVRSQKNAQLHAAATLATLLTAVLLRLSALEWCWIIAALAAVWMAEALNTSLELLCDVACPQFHPAIGRAKDVAAAAVLLTALAAAAIGACIFLPHVVAHT